MTSELLDCLRQEGGPRLERIRALIAATDRDEQSLRVTLVLVHEAVRRTLGASPADASGASHPRFDGERWGSDRRARMLAYQTLVERVRERTVTVVPPGGRVAIVSRGDDRLLQLEGRVAGHFPEDGSGRYAGYYPEEAAQAVEQLIELKSRGAQFVVFPATAFWWLEFYPELASWLRPALVWSGDECAIYELTQLEGAAGGRS
jgi:hypothetical protein